MARQAALEGIIPVVKQIEDAAREYVDVRDRRMALTKEEVDAKEVLIAAMKEERLEFYKTAAGLECVLSSVDTVKVKGAKGDDE